MHKEAKTMNENEFRQMIEDLEAEMARGEVPYTVNQERLEEMYEDLDAILAAQHADLDGNILYPQSFSCRLIWPQWVYSDGAIPSIRLVSPHLALSPVDFAFLAPHADWFELCASNDPDKFHLSWYYEGVIEVEGEERSEPEFI